MSAQSSRLIREKFMGPIWYVGAALVFLYALYRAIAHYTGDRMLIADDRSGHAGVKELPANSYWNSRKRIRVVESEDFVQSSQEDFLFFEIWSGSKTLDSAWNGVSPISCRGASPISFDEFAESIPWVPLESKIVVRQIGGADAHFLKRIAALPTKREILVLVDKSADLAATVQHEGGSR
jgi:hypothetical protein